MEYSNKDFPALKNTRLLDAAYGKEVDKVPVWVMRQAGRYLPEFQEVRAKHDFFTVCRTPELACEVTLQPLRRYDHLDASIIFSDILVIPQALGMTVEMHPGQGPVFPSPLASPSEIDELQEDSAVSRLAYVGKAITLTRHKIDGKVPLIGFTGAPFTLMGYMIEGGGSKTMSKTKEWLEKYPKDVHRLLALLTRVIIDYLVMQVESGAQLLQVFESSADHLTREQFADVSAPYLKDIRDGVQKKLQEKNLDQVPMKFVFALESLANGPMDFVCDHLTLVRTVKEHIKFVFALESLANGPMDFVCDHLTLVRTVKEHIKFVFALESLANGPMDFVCDHLTLVRTVKEHIKFVFALESLANGPMDFVCDHLTLVRTVKEHIKFVFALESLANGPMDFVCDHLTLVRTVKEHITVFAKGGGHSLDVQAKMGYETIGLDWTVDPTEARKIVGENITLQGNLDPQDLYKTPEEITSLTRDMVQKFGKRRYIANLGHGITPQTPLESMTAFTEGVHEAI